MTQFDQKLAELTPEARRKLAELVKSRAEATKAAEPPPAPRVPTMPPPLPAPHGVDPTGYKAEYRRFYDEVTEQLNSNVFGQFSFFLNYGYKSNGAPEYAQVALPDQYINRNSVKLVLEVIGECPITGKRVLDVGCGRGGTVHVFQTFFKPATIQGLDLSPAAIAFDRKAHKRADTLFHEGDAENLPFPDESVDVVTNLESSHSYPNINRFYSEVYRVLAPGGYFCYTDALSLQQKMSGIGYLKQIGFEIEHDRDITQNVLLSCDEIASTRVQAFDPRNDSELIENFLATPGSAVYRQMQTGVWQYFILRCRKRA